MNITIGKCLVPQCKGAGHRWEFDMPTLRELQRIEKLAGISVDEFAAGLDDTLSAGITSTAINAVLALVDILHRRDGVKVPFEDIDVSPSDFVLAMEDEPDAEDAGDGQGDGEGKDPGQTRPFHPREETAPAGPESGPATAEESTPRSSTTQTDFGGGSASP